MNRGGRVRGVLAAAVALAAATTGTAPARAASAVAPPLFAGSAPSADVARSDVPPLPPPFPPVPPLPGDFPRPAAPHPPSRVQAGGGRGASAAPPSPLPGCAPPSSTPVPDGKPIVVKLAPAAPFTVGKVSKTMWL